MRLHMRTSRRNFGLPVAHPHSWFHGVPIRIGGSHRSRVGVERELDQRANGTGESTDIRY